MPLDIVLPALSAGMEDGVVARWLKAEGEAVKKGELIAEIETDKATMELEAEADGVIGRLLVASGTRAKVDAVIAVLLQEGEDAAALAAVAAPAVAAAAVPAAAPAAPAAVAPAAAAVAPGAGEGAPVRHRASPLARRLAAARGISLEGRSGSGPHGRIVRIDIERAAASPAPAPVAAEPAAATSKAIPPGIGPFEAVPHTSMRRTIARRLLEAKQTVPHFYLNADCDLDELLALRARINARRDAAERISVNDFIIKACALALRKVPDANAIWTDEAILKLQDVDIAVAVATDGGLITPVVRQADKKSLGAISAEVKALAARARENRLKPEEYQGGGFSLSNLGMYGVTSFAAIINPPQSAILAVGAGERRPVERDGALAFATRMSVTLSVDHRTVDGALAGQWLAAFRAAVEDPMSLLV